MLARACLIFALSIALPLWSQVEPTASGGVTTADSDTYMTIPSVVSGNVFPLGTGPGERSNYLTGGLTFQSTYNDNALAGETSTPVQDMSYSVWPTLTLDMRSPRFIQSLLYSSGYTFYQKLNVLNSINQNIDANFQYRISPRTIISLSDYFRQNSNPFNQPYFVAGNVVPGPGATQNFLVIAPYASQLTNTTDGIASYQFALNGMVGAGGSFAYLDYPDRTQNSGIYNSMSGHALGFYSRRVARGQYLGGEYQFSRVTTSQVETSTDIQGAMGFYTRTADRGLNLSVTAGGQHLDFFQVGLPSFPKWEPAGTATIGWQTERVRLQAGYGRTVMAGQGLLGVFTFDNADGSIYWQAARTWNVNASGGYALSKAAISTPAVNYPGGHTVLGTISLGHQFNEQLRAQAGYTRFHRSYSSIAASTSVPDGNQVFVSISYQFSRPLGR